MRCKPDQGKTLPCFSKSKVSGHYNRTGDFIRFTDWRFIHKARLNLLKLNGTDPKNKFDLQKNRTGKVPDNPMQCRHCSNKFESLPHVLCHCLNNMQKITKRHDLVVERLVRASSGSWSVFKKNQPLAGSEKRPDLVLLKGDAAMILEVAITFENGPQAFNEIREKKVTKYQAIAKELKKTYKEVTTEVIVLGALGSWDPRNDRVCHRICTKKYTQLMRPLMVADTLRSSRDIYYEHVSPNSPQAQPPRYCTFFNQIALSPSAPGRASSPSAAPCESSVGDVLPSSLPAGIAASFVPAVSLPCASPLPLNEDVPATTSSPNKNIHSSVNKSPIPDVNFNISFASPVTALERHSSDLPCNAVPQTDVLDIAFNALDALALNEDGAINSSQSVGPSSPVALATVVNSDQSPGCT